MQPSSQTATDQQPSGQPSSPLINKVVLFGVLPSQYLTLQSIANNTITVGILSTYISGKQSEQKSPPDYEMWAYPDGIKIYDENCHVLNDQQPEHSFGPCDTIAIYGQQSTYEVRPNDFCYSFVFTDYALNRTYNSCLCWHEKWFVDAHESTGQRQSQNNFRKDSMLPKYELAKLMSQPFGMYSGKTMVYVPKCLLIFSTMPCFQFQREILRFYYRNVLTETEDALISERQIKIFRELVQQVGYPKGEQQYDTLASQPQPQLLKSKKSQPLRPGKYKQLSKQHLHHFYLSFMTTPALTPVCHNLTISDISNSTITFTPIMLQTSLCFSLPNINILRIIELLGVLNLLQLWKCIVLEKQIIIFSSNNSLIIDLCECMFFLIEPLKWQNVYIPFLPFKMHYHVDAMGGLLIGMARIHMNYMIQHFRMLEQKVMVDLDQNVIIQQGGKCEIDLPEQIRAMLEQRLVNIGIKKKKDRGFFIFKNDTGSTGNELEQVFRIKQIFFDGLLYLLNNYRPYAHLSVHKILEFNRQAYLNMLSSSKTWSAFARQLCNTMVFIRLCEYHLYEQKQLKWNQNTIGGLFVYCQNILAQRFPGTNMWPIPAYQTASTSSKRILPTLPFFKTHSKHESSAKIQFPPYHEYYNYVLKQNIDKMSRVSRHYRVEHYLVKYLAYSELQQQQVVAKRQEEPKSKSVLASIIGYLFPWYDMELDMDMTLQTKHLSLNYECLLDLTGMFTGMASIVTDTFLSKYEEYTRQVVRRKDMKKPRMITSTSALRNSL